ALQGLEPAALLRHEIYRDGADPDRAGRLGGAVATARSRRERAQPAPIVAGSKHTGAQTMELTILARFHAQDGQAEAVGAALEEVTAASRREAGCLAIQAYRATRDPRLFWIFSRWRDEAAFEVH